MELQDLSSSRKQTTSSSKKGYHPDRLTELVGEFGPWQLTWTSFGSLTIVLHCWMMLSTKFLTYRVDHWCARPAHLANVSVDAWLNMSAPLLPSGEYDRCHVFDMEFTAMHQRPVVGDEVPVVPCSVWEYDRSVFQDTATERWDLVCNRRSLPNLIQTVFFFGNFVGVLLSGILADKMGRKFCYCLFLTLWVICGVSGRLVNNLLGWMILRFLCGAFSLGYNNTIAVYSVELTHGRWRSVVNSIFRATMWSIGHMTLGGLVYGCRNMLTLELVIGLSATPFLLGWLIMPESPRWLLAKGRKDEAVRVLTKACKTNGRPVDGIADFVHSFTNDKIERRRANIPDLFRSPAIRRNTLLMSFAWFSFSMCYFGLVYNTPALNWNIFLVFVFPAFIGLFFCLIDPYLQNTLGRKFMLTVPLVVAGLLLLITLALPADSVAIICFAWTGTVLCGMAFASGYTFTKELFPTTLRTTALSTASAAARIGSIISPFVAMLQATSDVLPLLVYGSVAVAAGIGTLWLWPETRHIRLPDSIEDCERLASGSNRWLRVLTCNSRAATGVRKPAQHHHPRLDEEDVD